jgi:hypothetical protein
MSDKLTRKINRAEKRLTRANRHAVKRALRSGEWENLPARRRILTCPYGKGCCPAI